MTTRDEVIAAVRNEPADADFEGFREGSWHLIKPLTVKAAQWLYDHVASESLWVGGALVVEPAYIDTILEGANEAGFTFKGQITVH